MNILGKRLRYIHFSKVKYVIIIKQMQKSWSNNLEAEELRDLESQTAKLNRWD